MLVLVSRVPLLCAPLILPQARYPLVWGVGMGNVVYGTVSLSVLYLFPYVDGNTMSQMMYVWRGGCSPSEVGWAPYKVRY